MARLTPKEFLKRRQLLTEIWFHDGGATYAMIPHQMQRDLHDFFAPTELLTDKQAHQHRKKVSKAFPSLPQKAGRAYEALSAYREGRPNKAVAEYHAVKPNPTPTDGKAVRTDRNVRVFMTVRPKIDTYRLARAFINLSRTPEGQKMLDEIKERKAKEDT